MVRRFNESDHPRYRAGARDSRGGQFRDKQSDWAAIAAGRLGDMPDVISTPGWAERAADRTRPRGEFTDAELVEREKRVLEAVEANRHLVKGRVHEQWEMHEEIIAEYMGRWTHIPKERKAIMLGGLAGAGKSTALRQHSDVPLDDYMPIDADEIKSMLAERGAVPAIPGHEDLSPLERSTFIHAESVHIADALALRAMAAGYNVVWDATMGNSWPTDTRIEDLRRHDYEDILGVFGDVSIETSLERAGIRYRKGMREWQRGRGQGGRPMPPDFILRQRGSGAFTRNREAFEELKDMFDGWMVYDNNGSAPRLIDKK